MLYNLYIKKLKRCPFCNLLKQEIIKENENSLLILAKAPYSKDHLLVIPKKHVFSINELNKKQKQDLEELEFFALKKLHKKYKNVSVLYREGDKKQVGKSVDHLHIHLIPNMQIGSVDINNKKREVLDEEDYIFATKKAKEIIK